MSNCRAKNGSVVLAIDPGSFKCGVAVVAGDPDMRVLHKAVVDTVDIPQMISELCSSYSPDIILIGNGTTSEVIAKWAIESGLAIEIVDEHFTTVEARARYFLENPPRGLRKIIPISMQTPPQPYDDYVAVILAERYLAYTKRDNDK